jgi:sugar fermentation stimulation protein A
MVDGFFEDRPNRFICHVILEDGNRVSAHVPNTGRMAELLVKGAAVRLAYCPSPKRKTDYSLLTVKFHDHWVCTQAVMANDLVFEYLKREKKVLELEREVTYGDSRFDLKGRIHGKSGFFEVKSVNLVREREGKQIACFPDAPTVRGLKHLRGLIKAQNEGYCNGVFFVVQRSDADYVMPNWETDPDFAQTLVLCQQKGIIVVGFQCAVTETTIQIVRKIPVIFSPADL